MAVNRPSSRSAGARGLQGGGQHADGLTAHGPVDASFAGGPGPVSGPALQSSNRGALASRHLLHNPDIPAHHIFPGGRNPYLDRPLPPPPPPKTPSAAMSARPSTSGGPKASAPSSKFDRRMSKDDMFFTSKAPRERTNFDKRISRDDMYIRSQMASMAQFHIPARGQLLTPVHSPDSEPQFQASVPVRVATPESLTSGEIQIGMALGSPSHPPASYTSWQPQVPSSSNLSAVPEVVTTPAPEQPTLQRTKTGRRKLFGGLFGGRKHAEPVKQAEPREYASPQGSAMASPAGTPGIADSRTPTRSNTIADRKAPKYKPIIIRSNTEPFKAESPAVETRSQRTQDPTPLQPSVRRPAAQADLLRPPMPSTMSSSSRNFLDVEIPDIKMERYSVMFGNLLNQPQPASSLLARRQATLDKLKSINDRIMHEEEDKSKTRQRRATSPQPTKSPAFTLFPATPSGRTHLNPPTPRKLSPRMRSNTSPALLPSPSKPSFDLDQSRVEGSRGRTLVAPTPRPSEQRNVSKTRRRDDATNQSPNHGFYFNQNESSLVLDSPTEMEEEEVIVSKPFRPAIQEPEWEMISAPSSTASSMKKSPSSASSVQTHVTRPSVDVAIDEADAALKSAVEISIARQISISRQQRQLLRPLQTNASSLQARGRMASPNKPGVSPVNKLTRDERIQETKFSTPTLVHPRETLDSQLQQHRKSERIVLEAA